MDEELPDGKGLLLEMYDARALCRDASASFPALASELRASAESVHLLMGVLGRAVTESLGRGDEAHAEQVCAFLETALGRPRAISEIPNAVSLSFAGAEDFQASASGRHLWQRLPPTLKRLIEEQTAG